MADYATMVRKQIEAAREKGRGWNRLSQKAKENERLIQALESGPARILSRVLVGELAWHNAFSGQRTLFELYHELDDGNGKFTVYVNGERWRNGWSRSRFAEWLAGKIESVREDW